MAPHSSTLVWKIPWMEEPGRLQSMRSLRVRHDWATSFSLFTFVLWRRKWQPTPVFMPGESQGRGSLVACCLWGRTESDMTKWLSSSSSSSRKESELALPSTTSWFIMLLVQWLSGQESTCQCRRQGYMGKRGFPAGARGKESACQCRRRKRHRFDP